MLPTDSNISNSDSAATRSVLERLPDEIIVQILLQTDPNGFASLILLNRRWRQVSSQAYLYSHQLSRCPSYLTTQKSHSIPRGDSLSRLRSLFLREIKRNLFEAYLRPNEIIINLTTSPGNLYPKSEKESFQYSLSPHGHYILAYSSTRILVLDATDQEITVERGFKILQRPTSITITDDGSILAVLSSDLQVDIYDLTKKETRHVRAIILDHTPRTIALSPNGSVLAAAYDAGIEVSSLKQNNNSTDRRSVKCYTVDSLNFSSDGSQILGTTLHTQNPSTVVLTAPYFDTGATLQEDSVSALWTTSILFPNGSRDCSHAALLPNSEGEEANWAFAYDRVFETFRAVRIDDLRNGTTYFTGPVADSSISSKLLPSSLPAANKSGNVVASAFDGFIWLYGIPKNLEAMPISKNNIYSSIESGAQSNLDQSTPSSSESSVNSNNRQNEEFGKIPQWQHLGDKARNTFVEGRNVSFFQRVSDLTWVKSSKLSGDRLIAVASKTSNHFLVDEDKNTQPVDTGQIMILDFTIAPLNGKRSFITINVDVNNYEMLDKDKYGLETELTRVRMRNLAQQDSRSHVVQREVEDASNSFLNRIHNDQRMNNQTYPTSSEEEVFDTPYSHSSPRSGSTLRRAATAAAINRRFDSHVTNSTYTIEYRRVDGQEEYPHESDADDWVPPPPPYTCNSTVTPPEHSQDNLSETKISNTLPMCLNQALNINRCNYANIDRCYQDQNAISENIEEYYRESSLQQHGSCEFNRSAQNEPGPSHDYAFDDRYDVSPTVTPPLGSPQFNGYSQNPPEEVIDGISMNESLVIPSNGDVNRSEVSSILDQPIFSIQDSTIFSDKIQSPKKELLTGCQKLPDVTSIGSRKNKNTHSWDQLFRSKDDCNFPDRQKTFNNLTQRVENRVERLSTKFPLSNKIVSATRSFRGRTPKMLRRSTAPESVDYASQSLDRSKYLSSHEYTQARPYQYRHFSEDNIQNDRYGLQNNEIFSDSFYFSSQNTSFCCASSQSHLTSQLILNGNRELHLQSGDGQVINPESHASGNSHETFNDLSLPVKLSRKIVADSQGISQRKSLPGNKGGPNNSANLAVGHNESKFNINYSSSKQLSSLDVEVKKKKCTIM